MAEMKPGSVGWMDLTVGDAVAVRDFYQQVTGWTATAVDMGGYEDFSMVAPGGTDPVAGICHARGPNAELPPVWMPYIIVEDLDKSMTRCAELGGSVFLGPKSFGSYGRWCALRDPAGATVALFQPATEEPSGSST